MEHFIHLNKKRFIKLYKLLANEKNSKFELYNFPYICTTISRAIPGETILFEPIASQTCRTPETVTLEKCWVWIPEIGAHVVRQIGIDDSIPREEHIQFKDRCFKYQACKQLHLNKRDIVSYVKGNVVFSLHPTEGVSFENVLMYSVTLNNLQTSKEEVYEISLPSISKSGIVFCPETESFYMISIKDKSIIHIKRDEGVSWTFDIIDIDAETSESVLKESITEFTIENGITYFVNIDCEFCCINLRNASPEEDAVIEKLDFVTLTNLDKFSFSDTKLTSGGGSLFMSVKSKHSDEKFHVLQYDINRNVLDLLPYSIPRSIGVDVMEYHKGNIYLVLALKEVEFPRNPNYLMEFPANTKLKIHIASFTDLEICTFCDPSQEDGISSVECSIVHNHSVSSLNIKSNQNFVASDDPSKEDSIGNNSLESLEKTAPLFIKKYAEMKGHKLPIFTNEVYNYLKDNYSGFFDSVVQPPEYVDKQTQAKDQKLSILTNKLPTQKKSSKKKKKKDFSKYLQSIVEDEEEYLNILFFERLGDHLNALFIPKPHVERSYFWVYNG